MTSRWMALGLLLALAGVLGVLTLLHSPPAARVSAAASHAQRQPATAAVLANPIDSRYLTDVGFGRTSFWIQPWRAYMDTWPASRLVDAAGINFNVDPAEAEPTAQLLQASGFKLARVGINWSALSYSDPTRFDENHQASIRARLTALRDHGLRPLILLDANSGAPAPSKGIKLETVAPAPAGSRTVTLTAPSAAEVIPGKTGFDGLAFGGSPDILITSVGEGGVATLSRPLPGALAAGAHGATTLLYAPFERPTLADGEPNPAFQATLAGWLGYVAATSREVASIVGPGGYDLEVWNELTFGSQFLNSEHYYSSGGEEERKATVTKEVTKALLAATVAYVRDPANGISPAVGITDGFASQTPFPSGANAPVGLTALSKHPYANLKSFPGDYRVGSMLPVDALGAPDTLPGEKRPYTPLFVPSFEALLPEFTLTAIPTETLVRDLAPLTTHIYGLAHGRMVGPTGGSPVQKWITEYNLSVPKASSAALTTADTEHFRAKALLRSLVAMVSKGMTREYFYAAASGQLSLIGAGFWSALKANPGSYPGDQLGGEVMTGFRNMLGRFTGPGPSAAPQQLALTSIAQEGNHAQFIGDGTPAHPDLYDRDVLAVLPFQSSPTHFVIPVYVMTRNLLTLYRPKGRTSDVTRFDLPNETFYITLGNLPIASRPPKVTAYDPLRGVTSSAKLISLNGDTGVFRVVATDYPRILSIDYTRR